MAVFSASFMSEGDFSVSFQTSGTFSTGFEGVIFAGGEETYEGTYEVTPGQEAQTLSTADRLLEQDIIINAIPQNYGLITWNGNTLTVS